MNQKAQKQTIQWPPMYQLMNDEPVIDPSFRNVESLNAPYLNDMLSPVYIHDTESVGVYDKDGNRYEISEGYLTRNGESLFPIESKKFVRTDVTEQFVKYHDYDITDTAEAYTIWNGSNNSFTITFGQASGATDSLYNNGVVIASRIRIIGNTAIFVAYYDIDDEGYVIIATLDSDGVLTQHTREAKWFRQTIRRNATTAMTYQKYYVTNAFPIITIAEVADRVIGISLVAEYGRAFNTTKNYFITYFMTDGEVYQLDGTEAAPTSETSTVTVTNTISATFKVDNVYSNSSFSGTCISANDSDYYDYTTEGVIGDNLNIPVTYTPTATGNTVTIDDVEYKIYNYKCSKVTSTYTVTASDSNITWSLKGISNYDDTEYSVEVSTAVEKVLKYEYLYWRGETISGVKFHDVYVTWMDEEERFPENNRRASILLKRTVTETVSAGWLVSPNVVLDSGSLYSLWNIDLTYYNGNSWTNQVLTAGNIIEESGVILSSEIADSKFSYTISPTEYVTVTSDYNVARSNSFAINQNIAVSTVKLNNTAATSSYTLYNNGGTAGGESESSKFLEYSNSNVTDLRYYPGTTRDTTFNYFGSHKYSGDTIVGNAEDQPVFVVQGYRTEVNKGSPFNILYNVDSSGYCLPQGISYSSTEDSMGTLIAPWQSIDDDFYIAANSKFVVYRDKSDRYYKITIEDGNELSALLDDRYILVNTTSYWNMYDSVLMKKFHYATDYNDRLMFGQTLVPTSVIEGANSSGAVTYSRYTATAINAAYRIMPMYAVSGIIMPSVIRLRVGITAEKAFKCAVEESSDTQPIDVYYGTVGGTSANYRYSVYPYATQDTVIRFDLVGSTYTVTSGLYLSPNIFTEFISGAGNNDIVKETYSTYTLTYYDQRPFFIYNASSEVSAQDGSDIFFFVIQGQFYAFMNEKIYSMVYSSGAISAQDAIIDCRGMVFLGNTPQIAFFYSPRNRSIYSFTGDALLQHLYNADKLTGITSKHWYDETTQSVYVPSDYGLLVIGPNNIYVFKDWKNVTNCQFDNKLVTHITNNDTTINLVYYATEGYEVLPLELETSFYGIGANEWTSIDRWDIVLYDRSGTKPTTTVTAGVRSITDITVKSEEKKFTITPDMWDKWSNSVLLRYVPKLQKGQGIRLHLKSEIPIVRIVPHIADMGTGTLTRRGL